MTLSINKKTSKPRGGFTLIELILVMALLIVIISIVTPKMAQFFGSRTLDSEERRFVALTHYAQSRAVSEGVPMFLWINPGAGAYGLQQETGYTDGDPKSVEYRVGESLKLGLGKSSAKSPAHGKLSGIHFAMDGTVVAATSVNAISLQELGHAPVWIMQSADGLNYEVQN